MLQRDEATALLSRVDGCTFAALDTLTVPILYGGKNNPFQGKVEKHARGHRVMLFTNKFSSGYENRVRKMLIREGKNPDSFKLSALRWGERMPESPFITHKGKYYLQCVFLESGEIEYRATDAINVSDAYTERWYNPGDTIPKEVIVGLKDDESYVHQGLEPSDAVIVRAFDLNNIVALRAFNEELV